MTPQEMDIVDALSKMIDEIKALRLTIEKITVQSQVKAKEYVDHVRKPVDGQGMSPQDARAKMGLKGMAQELANRSSEEKFKKFWQGLADKEEYALGANQTLEEKITKSWYKVVTLG